MPDLSGHIVLCVLLTASVGLASCQGQDRNDDEDQAGPRSVAIHTVGTGQVVRYLKYIGDIEGEAEIRVFSPIPDRITSLSAKEGDKVNEGQILAKVRSKTLSQGVDQAAGGLDAARAQRNGLTDQHERLKRLEGSGAVSSSQLLAVESQLAGAEAQVRQLEAMLGQARQRRGDATIRSPISGVIGQVFVKVGDLAVPQIPICTVVAMDQVRVKVKAPEPDLPFLNVGQPVELRVAVDDAEPIHGQVTKVGPVLDRLSRTATMEIHLANPGHSLKPGMLARIKVAVEQRSDVVLAPKSALTVTAERVEGKPVYRAVVSKNGKAEERQVLLGIEEGQQVEILSGLTAGDQLVIDGQHLLAPGDPVEPSPPPPPSDES